jgi:hypothetical protein
MTKPTHENKFTVRTAPVIVAGVKMAVAQMSSRNVLYRGRKVGIEGLVGAIVHEFLKLSRDEQEAYLRRVIPEVEALFEGAAPKTETPAEGVAGGEGKPLPGGGRITTIVPESPPPARKGRRGKAGG